MTAITTLRDEIGKHPADSDVARLLSWAELTMGDLHDRIFELEEDVRELHVQNDRRAIALNQVHEALFIVQRYAMLQGHEMSGETFARDFAPFRNVMAHHGVEPYAKPKRAKK